MAENRQGKIRVRGVAEMVKDILQQFPKTRESDNLLYAYILNKYGISRNETFWNIYSLVKNAVIPSIESVGRARRKAQELYPELQASDKVRTARINYTAEYIDFAMDKSI